MTSDAAQPHSDWRSELVEILRHGTYPGMLMGIPDLIAQGGDQPVRRWETSLSQEEFEEWRRARRYVDDGRADRATELDEKVSRAVSKLMAITATSDPPSTGHALQIDVVANAKEISMLPLELARGADGQPL